MILNKENTLKLSMRIHDLSNWHTAVAAAAGSTKNVRTIFIESTGHV